MRAALRITLRSATSCPMRSTSIRATSTAPQIHSVTQARAPPTLVTVRSLSVLYPPRQHPNSRTFSSSFLASTSTSSQFSTTSFPDSHRPDLFYHFFDSPTPLSPALPAYALSLLPTPPPYIESATILGWLPAQVSEAESRKAEDDLGLDEEQKAGLNDFHENQKFVKVLHQSIKGGLEDHVDDIWINGAKQIQNGWMHIHDQRNTPPLGRIGDPDDIIGSVLVKDSEIQADTYQPMPSYRVCTADGPMQLTAGFAKRLHETLAHVAEVEKADLNP